MDPLNLSLAVLMAVGLGLVWWDAHQEARPGGRPG